MQLPLDNDPRSAILRRVHEALYARFGPMARAVNEQRDPVWTLVQGVIGARTRTAVSNAATDRLLALYGTWKSVASAPEEDLRTLISQQTYPQQSARRLLACLQTLIEARGEVDLRHLSNMPTAEAMAWLETLPGVGRKIAAGVMNTSIFARPALVIDSHHRRIVQRLGLVPPRASTARAYDVLAGILPPEWSATTIDEHHLLVKRLGQTLCRPAYMECATCPLAPDCVTARSRATS